MKKIESVLWVWIQLLVLCCATVYVGFPLNEQLPDVGRINEQYKFTMANITYKATKGEVIYSASNLPHWLSFDGDSRTFSGTPSQDDVGESTITLEGKDSEDGDTLSKEYSILVSDSKGIKLKSKNIMDQEIRKYGHTDGLNGLVAEPGSKVNLRFNSSLFEEKPDSKRRIQAFYGRSADRSPLPDWISFNPDSLSFTGTIPHVISEIAPSKEYNFALIASDYKNYGGAEAVFKIVVGAHELSTTAEDPIKINGTYNEDFEIEVPILHEVYLDGSEISKENVSNITTDNLPGYISFNHYNYSMTGNFPDYPTVDNFAISIQDRFGDSVHLYYMVNVTGSLFTKSAFSDVNATRGQFFQHQLLKSLFSNRNVSVSVDYDADWLKYDKSNRTLIGQTPKDFQNLEVKVAASLGSTHQTKSFSIDGVSKSHSSLSSSSSSLTSRSSASSSATPLSVGGKKSKNGGVNKKALAIGLGVALPLFVIFVVAAILFACCLNRRKKNTNNKSEEDDNYISQPEAGELPSGAQVNAKEQEEAKRLATLNAMKLDAKDTSDSHSLSSSSTQVALDGDDTKYFNSTEVPFKSWRANDSSDMARSAKNPKSADDFRYSGASASTVNTENLFSVKLINDGSFSHGQFAQNLQNTNLSRDDSGNIQRLDSDGNIINLRDAGKSLNKNDLSRFSVISKEQNDEQKRNSHQDKELSSDSSSSNLLARLNGNVKRSYSSENLTEFLDQSSRLSRDRAYDNEDVKNGRESFLSEANTTSSRNVWLPSKDSLDNAQISKIASYSRTSLPKGAKLVNLDGKSSLRDSSQEALNIEGSSAPVKDGDADSI